MEKESSEMNVFPVIIWVLKVKVLTLEKPRAYTNDIIQWIKNEYFPIHTCSELLCSCTSNDLSLSISEFNNIRACTGLIFTIYTVNLSTESH